MEVLIRTRETKRAEELQAMILEDLSKMDDCPQSGVTVTVCGIPWKSMLMFGSAAGPVRNKAELQTSSLSVSNDCTFAPPMKRQRPA